MANRTLNSETLQKYELKEKTFLADKNADAYLLEHKKSGARVALVLNDDNNKVFYIGFRTTPEDSTGVAHITEHSVLCGSRDFPVKDPFVELIKGSLNTFLNAITYPDKTVYPVASCNEQDFKNLMHVYLDAVFHPLTYTDRRIFDQEGWRYELSDDGTLTYNGVVYNEMKGALSSPDDVLENAGYAALYPDTTYAMESGGNPRHIPELTYEAFLDFHRRCYHPSNSYVYLYGDIEPNAYLAYIDEAYLSEYDRIDADTRIAAQEPFEAPARRECSYAVLDDEDEAGKSFLAMYYGMPAHLDAREDTALKVLDYVLCDAEGAPLKQALYDAGIGEDVGSVFEDSILQPYEAVISRFCDASQAEIFEKTITDTLTHLADEGIDRRALQAAIAFYEFRYREADFGGTPKGLIYGLQALDTWLYDDGPFDRMDIGGVFGELKKDAESGYFEALIRKYYLENPHRALIVMAPKKGLTEKWEKETKERLASYLATLTPEETEEIRRRNKDLESRQDTPDTEENLRKIPLLTRQDLGKKAPELSTNISETAGIRILQHEIFTNQILYLDFLFDMEVLTDAQMDALVAFKTLFAALDTEQYSYARLDQEIHIVTGGIGASGGIYTSVDDRSFSAKFEVTMKVMRENLAQGMELLRHILTKTRYDDAERIREVLEEERSAMRASLQNAGHATATLRALASFTEPAALVDRMSGIAAYRYLDELLEHYGERKDELLRTLRDMAARLFSAGNYMVDVTAPAQDAALLDEPLRAFDASLPEKCEKAVWAAFAPKRRREAFVTAGQVQYAACAGNFADKGFAFKGTLRVLRHIMSYGYLWKQLREKGGAYGCGSSYGRDGAVTFYSFRDPHLARTIDVFHGASEFAASFEADERTMTKYIIGTVSAMDTPMTPAVFGKYCLSAHMTGLSYETLQRERDEVLAAQPEDIRSLAELLKETLSDEAVCVIGTAAKIEEHRALFDSVEKLV
ncbi:MAG: insulinase family protein [Lachnospiraceae bacterium]|nr:insulinase family protein [Lachnospiraceae bacterium]